MKFLGHDPLNINFTNEKSYREITKNNKIDLTKFLMFESFIDLIKDLWDFLKLGKSTG